MTTISYKDLTQLLNDVFDKAGMSQDSRNPLVQTIVDAERDHAHSHGIFRVPGYWKSLQSGKVNANAVPKVEKLAPAIIKVDGDRGFAPSAREALLSPLIDAAKSQGIAMGAVRNCFHFAALWRDVEPLAEKGLIGLVCTCANAFVAPWGGATPLFGTNPLAFAWPRTDGMVVFDQASSAMARGEIMIAGREGREVPLGTGVDKHGKQTTNPAEILAGAQSPFGGYKGSAIAMMIELLAGALIGENLSVEATAEDNKDGGPARGGMFFLAIDPEKCGDRDHWQSHGEKLFEQMLAIDGVRLPGQRRLANRAANQSSPNVDVNDAMLQAVKDLIT